MCQAQEQQQTNNTYNGWSNYETWLAGLWLTNDQSNYCVLQEALELKGEALDKANCLKKHMSWQLEDEITEASLWQDLLQCAFDRINWIEIINNNLE